MALIRECHQHPQSPAVRTEKRIDFDSQLQELALEVISRKRMLYRLGRLLQLAGLVILPVAIAGNAVRPNDITLWRMLGLSGIGVAAFTLGWLLQRGGPPR